MICERGIIFSGNNHFKRLKKLLLLFQSRLMMFRILCSSCASDPQRWRYHRRTARCTGGPWISASVRKWLWPNTLSPNQPLSSTTEVHSATSINCDTTVPLTLWDDGIISVQRDAPVVNGSQLWFGTATQIRTADGMCRNIWKKPDEDFFFKLHKKKCICRSNLCYFSPFLNHYSAAAISWSLTNTHSPPPLLTPNRAYSYL